MVNACRKIFTTKSPIFCGSPQNASFANTHYDTLDCCIMHLDINALLLPRDALIYQSQKVLKFTLKFILKCSYMFRSMTIIRELIHNNNIIIMFIDCKWVDTRWQWSFNMLHMHGPWRLIIMSVSPSVRIEQRGSHWTDFHKI